MKVHTPSPLQTIYAQHTFDLDRHVLRNLVPFVQLKNVKNIRGGVLLLVKLLEACIFIKSNTPL